MITTHVAQSIRHLRVVFLNASLHRFVLHASTVFMINYILPFLVFLASKGLKYLGPESKSKKRSKKQGQHNSLLSLNT